MSLLHLCGLPVQSGVCSVWTRAERGLRFALLRSSQSADAFQCVMRSAAIAVHVSVCVCVVTEVCVLQMSWHCEGRSARGMLEFKMPLPVTTSGKMSHNWFR